MVSLRAQIFDRRHGSVESPGVPEPEPGNFRRSALKSICIVARPGQTKREARSVYRRQIQNLSITKWQRNCQCDDGSAQDRGCIKGGEPTDSEWGPEREQQIGNDRQAPTNIRADIPRNSERNGKKYAWRFGVGVGLGVGVCVRAWSFPLGTWSSPFPATSNPYHLVGKQGCCRGGEINALTGENFRSTCPRPVRRFIGSQVHSFMGS